MKYFTYYVIVLWLLLLILLVLFKFCSVTRLVNLLASDIAELLLGQCMHAATNTCIYQSMHLSSAVANYL